MKIQLGSIVKDKVTGIKGVAVCTSEWLWGCNRVGVQPQEVKDGKPVDDIWFDEDRLEVVEVHDKKFWFGEEKAAAKPPTGGPDRERRDRTEG